ncbi:MAG: hypothetical protein KDJ36_17220 [Hyphomicrobiaceae bacterium]|nr:hypothetical protein [Planctomycetales bacterium]MCB1512638.1 hypothetical protein [Hyphomicrobiaceae bacterium]
MSDSDRTFIGGNRNPWKYGMSLRASNGDAPDPEAIERAATILGRTPFFVDRRGYECELIAAAVQSPSNRVVYVESRAKKRRWTSMVDITIKIHYVDANGKSASVDIESYNPFFGCDVGMMEWINDDVALLIYSEKHWTFVYRIGDTWPPKFAKIDERWSIKDDVLSFMAYNADVVHRLQIPSLESLADIPVSEAEADGSLPPDPYAC